MNIGGVFLLAFIGSLAQSAPAQAAYSVSYTQLFSFVTWTSIGLMGAAAAVAGQNLGAGRPDRTAAAVHIAARIGVAGAAIVGLLFFFIPGHLLAIFGIQDPAVVPIGAELLGPERLGPLHFRGADLYRRPPGHGRHQEPALHLDRVADPAPARHLFRDPADRHAQPIHIWLAILAGHATRFSLSFFRFGQGKWRGIAVDIEPAPESA